MTGYSSYGFAVPFTARIHIWFSFFLFLVGFPILAVVHFSTFFMFFFDENNYEIIYFEEYFLDLAEEYNFDPEQAFHKVSKTKQEIESDYEERGQELPKEFTRFSDNSGGPSGDFDLDRHSNEWDYLAMATELDYFYELVKEEWEHDADVVVDPFVPTALADLEHSYVHFFTHRNRDPENAIRSNTCYTKTQDLVASSLVSPDPLFNTKNTVRTSPVGFRSFLYQHDDFRFRYWKRQNQKKLKLK